jgi:hypothetical protein
MVNDGKSRSGGGSGQGDLSDVELRDAIKSINFGDGFIGTQPEDSREA